MTAFKMQPIFQIQIKTDYVAKPTHRVAQKANFNNPLIQCVIYVTPLRLFIHVNLNLQGELAGKWGKTKAKGKLREKKTNWFFPNPFETKLFSHFLFYSQKERSWEKSAAED